MGARRSDVIHERFLAVRFGVDFGAGVVDAAADLGEGGLVKDSGDGVADFAHDHAGTAGSDVDALVALAEGGFAGAGEGGEGAFHDADDGTERDVFGRLGEGVAAAFALLAFDEAFAFEVEEDIFEEVLRDGFVFGDFGDEGGACAVGSREGVEGSERVLGLPGEGPHGSFLYSHFGLSCSAMTKKILLAGVLGGLAMFVWSGIAHMASPLAEVGISQIEAANEKPFLTAMDIVMKGRPGLYFFPGLPKGESQTDHARKLETSPSGLLLYAPAGAKMLETRQMIVEILVEILEALLLAFLLSKTTLSGFGPQFGFVVAAAVFGTIWTNLSYMNWYGFPLSYTLAYWFMQFIGMLVGGLVVIRVLKK